MRRKKGMRRKEGGESGDGGGQDGNDLAEQRVTLGTDQIRLRVNRRQHDRRAQTPHARGEAAEGGRWRGREMDRQWGSVAGKVYTIVVIVV